MERQYNELQKAYTKEVLASMIKADIRSRFPEPYASINLMISKTLQTSLNLQQS